MGKSIIRLLSFFSKEVNEIRRQPRLVLSLLFGPLAIMLLFGAGYQGERPNLRMALVVPEGAAGSAQIEQLKQTIANDPNFQLIADNLDYDTAMGMLRANQIDVVEVLPEDAEQRVLKGEQAPVAFKYNEVNPLNEQWIQYLGYAQVNEINRAILQQTTQGAQQEAVSTQQMLSDMRERLGLLKQGLNSSNKEETLRALQQLEDTLGVLAASPLALSQVSSDGAGAQSQIFQLRDDLRGIKQAISDGTLDRQRGRIETALERMDQLKANVELFSSLPSQVIVSPLIPSYENIYQIYHPAPSEQLNRLMIFYTPSVVALMLQHIAVTLGSLSLVRERLLGAIELFRVAPVSMGQVLVGKYLGYTLFIGIIAAMLTALSVFGLGVPFLGDVLLFSALVGLLIIASLGVGFLISLWSTSESQAVQLSMLVLLLSIFFSGFFLPLENFWPPIRNVGYALPLTHGIVGFQSIMLRGLVPSAMTWVLIGTIAGGTFVAATLLAGWRYRRI